MNKNLFLPFFAFIFFSLILTNVLAINSSISPGKIILSGEVGKVFHKNVLIRNLNEFPVNITLSTTSMNIGLGEDKFRIEPNFNQTANFTVTINEAGVQENVINIKYDGDDGSTTTAYLTISINGTGEGIPGLTITSQLSPETPNAIAGEDLKIIATLNNTGFAETNYSISAYGYEGWGNLVEIYPETLTIENGMAEDAVIDLRINNNVKGSQNFKIKVDYNGTSKESIVSLIIQERTRKDIAYVVNDPIKIEYSFINAINELGYDYDIINDANIGSTNFSDYEMILIGNDGVKNVPVNDYKSLIANPNYYSGWSMSKSSTSKGNVYNANQDISITKNLSKDFIAYTQTSALYYLTGRKYSANSVSTTGNSTIDLGHFVIAVKDTPRRVFFGITKSQYWNSESKELFKNSIKWIIEGEDKDKDGYYTDFDCNDNNASIWENISGYADFDKDGFGAGNLVEVCSGEHLLSGYSLINGDCNNLESGINPNATEIPYNGIDENCDGFDLKDVDKDGKNYPDDCNDNNASIWKSVKAYADKDKDGFGSGQLIDLCIGNLLPENYSYVNGDCNDNNSGVNPNATEIMDDIDQNCINDAPVLSEDIEDLEWNEDGAYLKIIDLKKYIKDTDGDKLNFSVYNVSDSESIMIGINNGVLSFSSKDDWNGEGWVVFKAEDGRNASVLSNNISLKINPVNDAPKIINKGNLTATLNEDFGSYEFNLSNFKGDVDNNAEDLIWEIEYVNGRFNATINNNTLKLDSLQDENCLEACGISLKLTDSGNKSDKGYFKVVINPLNDAPVLKKEIENITWNQNTNLTYKLDLKNYFYDVDGDKLNYSFTGNSKITLEMNNGVLSFYPEEEWNGSEKVIFTAYDTEFNISSNEVMLEVLYVKKPPKFEVMNCTTALLEDTNYSCELNASDAENDSFNFSVAINNHLNCTVNGTTLNYIGNKDYFGNASCVLRVRDMDGYSDVSFNVQIEDVNDAPYIASYSPENQTRVLVNTSKEFKINPRDIENNNLTISWVLGNESVGNETSYMFSKPEGFYNLTAVVSDGMFNASNIWNIFVGTINNFKCSEVSGHLCSEKQICSGELLKVYDSVNCCSVACSAKPPEFKSLNKRENITSEILLSIRNIGNSNEFYTGDSIQVELNIENNADKNIDFDIDAYLYDITKENVINKNKISFDINKDSNKYSNIELKVPMEANEDDEFAIFVMIHGKGSKKDYYNEKYVTINIGRKTDAVFIDEVEFSPKDILCGDSVQFKVKAINYGASDENAYITLENSQLKINEKSSDFDLESHGNDDEAEKDFMIDIPKNVNAGNYTIKANVFYKDKKDSKDIIINLGECRKQNTETIPVDNEKTSGIRLASKVTGKSDFSAKTILIIICSVFILIMFVLILIMGRVYKQRENNKTKLLEKVLTKKSKAKLLEKVLTKKSKAKLLEKVLTKKSKSIERKNIRKVKRR